MEKPTVESIIDKLTADAYANIGKQFTAIADAQEQINEAIVLAEVLESVNAQPLTCLHGDSVSVWVTIHFHTNAEVLAAITAARLEIIEDVSNIDDDYAKYRISGFQVNLWVQRPQLSELKLAA